MFTQKRTNEEWTVNSEVRGQKSEVPVVLSTIQRNQLTGSIGGITKIIMSRSTSSITDLEAERLAKAIERSKTGADPAATRPVSLFIPR